MKTIDPKDFVLSPEDLAEMKESSAESPSTHKPQRGLEFYQFPKTVVDTLVRANYGPAWALAAAVYRGWYGDFRKRNPVKLTTALLAEFKISRDQKWRALKVLEQTGQFLVERSPGRNPLVMMKWKLPKD
jgi:hypothetical protein